jgi:hypothetical protein
MNTSEILAHIDSETVQLQRAKNEPHRRACKAQAQRAVFNAGKKGFIGWKTDDVG